MRSLSILERAWSRLQLKKPPARIVELGAGDGTLLLRLAKTVHPQSSSTQLVLLDRQQLVSAETIDQYRRVGWNVEVQCDDALRWAAVSPSVTYDLCITTLFLHHFRDPELALLLGGVAARSDAFIAIEPYRGTLATVGSRLIGVLGAGAVTREDAVKSVEAGFVRGDITAAWAQDADSWWTQEFRAFPFSHCFLAARQALRSTGH
jgi:SAM-dependent methyltransferase